jgi:hypothetical protein
MISTEPTMKELYDKLRAQVFQDPIMIALFRHEIDWADVEEHPDYKATAADLLLNEQLNIMDAIQQDLQLTALYNDKEERTSKVRFADPSDTSKDDRTPFEQIKAVMFQQSPSQPVQTVQHISPDVLFNPRQIKTVIARNLPRDITTNELNIIFDQYGPIRDIYIPRNTDRSSPYFGSIKGFALIKYLSSTDSTRAVMSETNRLHIRGKQISIEYAKEDR